VIHTLVKSPTTNPFARPLNIEEQNNNCWSLDRNMCVATIRLCLQALCDVPLPVLMLVKKTIINNIAKAAIPEQTPVYVYTYNKKHTL
jgi:hypothetical protein